MSAPMYGSIDRSVIMPAARRRRSAMTDAVRKRFTFVLVLALASFGLLLFDAGPAEAVTPPPECGAATADYPQNHFRVCFFSGTNPAMEDNYLGTENEPSVANPVPDRIFAINRQWRTYPTPDWIADVVYDPACTDGFDNDGVGGIDANDIDCAPIGEGPIGATACFDG